MKAGTSQPTLEVLRRIAVALSLSTDQLAFGEDGRGPNEDLRLHLEAASRLDPDEQAVVRTASATVLRRCSSGGLRV